MRLSHATWVVCLLDLVLPGPPAFAMQFEQIQISATEVIIGGRGPIVKGDAARLDQALAQVPQAKRLLALALDSPGGLVSEGVLLAELIRTRKVPVVIPSNSQCVSACFLLLAASPRRMAASDALVGVHSANENQQETDTSLAVTTLMARDAAKNGIPPAIVGKMVETTPGRVEWLTHDDLVSMNVAVYDGDTPTATRQTVTASVPRVAPSPLPTQSPTPPPMPSALPAAPPLATAIPGQTSVPPGFAAGRDDRHAWDAWLAGLQGQYRDGAAFAKAQIGLPRPGSCVGPNGANRGDFTLGCEAARQRLAPVATKLAINADFAAGWNSAGQTIPTGAPAEAEYRGAYFCGPLVAQLTLKVFPQSGEPRRRAMFSFGPEATSPGVPRGAFIVEGSIDLQGGAMTLTPVKWVSQPQGYNWLGLSGRSDDGGKTFRGRVTDSGACTSFTLQRVSAATATR
ncbi:MAG TPA: hypothetical protein VFE41_30720 [Acetobacteraceae bacterium]|jgi:hypothetical protein|nr:hypothetical protein [Acetobacteraceae bacterium]